VRVEGDGRRAVRNKPRAFHRYVIRALGAALVSFVGANAAMAQATTNATKAAPENSYESSESKYCFGGLSGITYGAPLKLAVGAAVGIRHESQGGDFCTYASPKLGMGGARFDLGLARNVGSFGGAGGVSGGILRTFGAPSRADRMSTYAGGSLHVLPVLAFGLELGYYKRLGGRAGVGREHIIVWSLGFGF
jgi:hypothetical protein